MAQLPVTCRLLSFSELSRVDRFQLFHIVHLLLVDRSRILRSSTLSQSQPRFISSTFRWIYTGGELRRRFLCSNLARSTTVTCKFVQLVNRLRQRSTSSLCLCIFVGKLISLCIRYAKFEDCDQSRTVLKYYALTKIEKQRC